MLSIKGTSYENEIRSVYLHIFRIIEMYDHTQILRDLEGEFKKVDKMGRNEELRAFGDKIIVSDYLLSIAHRKRHGKDV